jgi:hypothetical protein
LLLSEPALSYRSSVLEGMALAGDGDFDDDFAAHFLINSRTQRE